MNILEDLSKFLSGNFRKLDLKLRNHIYNLINEKDSENSEILRNLKKELEEIEDKKNNLENEVQFNFIFQKFFIFTTE